MLIGAAQERGDLRDAACDLLPPHSDSISVAGTPRRTLLIVAIGSPCPCCGELHIQRRSGSVDGHFFASAALRSARNSARAVLYWS